MFNQNKSIKETPGYRYVKKQVPFSVKNIDGPQHLFIWRAQVEQRSIIKRAAARDKAIAAFCAPKTDICIANYAPTYKPKISIFTRIYNHLLNLFLNVKFN